MIRLGVIGHGLRISGVVKSVLRAINPEVRVVGIVDPDEPGARGRLDERDRADVKFYGSFKELVRGAKPDGILIGTRCHLHAPYAIEAAATDIPLYLEKPVAHSMAQATALERAFKKSKCPVVVSFPLRVSPLCTMAKEFLDAGAVGRPEHVLAVNYVPYGTCYWDYEYRNFKVTQGLFLQKATHDFDYLCYLLGATITRVGAMGTYGRVFGGRKPAGLYCSKCKDQDSCLESPQNRIRNGSGGRTDDHLCLFGRDCGSPKTGTNEDSSSALLEFSTGIHGAYTQVFYTRRDAGMRGPTISGYHGTLSFDWYKKELRRVFHHRPFSETMTVADTTGHAGGDHELGRDFLDIIRGKGRSRTSVQAGIQSVYTCLAAKESAETGKFVNVRQVG